MSLNSMPCCPRSCCRARFGRPASRWAGGCSRSAEVFPSDALALYLGLVTRGAAAGHQPLAFAVVARSLGVPLQEALAAYLFATVTSLTQNAVRAIPLGQNAGQRVLRKAHDDVAAATERIARLAPDDFGSQPRTGNFADAARTPACPDVHELTGLVTEEEHHD